MLAEENWLFLKLKSQAFLYQTRNRGMQSAHFSTFSVIALNKYACKQQGVSFLLEDSVHIETGSGA